MNNKNNANVNEVKEIDGYIQRQRVLNVISNLQEEYESRRKEIDDDDIDINYSKPTDEQWENYFYLY